MRVTKSKQPGSYPPVRTESCALTWLHRIAGTSEHAELIADCLRALEMFRVSRQLDVLDDLLAGPVGREVTVS